MRVVVVDDVLLFREGLSALLCAIGEEVVAQAGSAADAFDQVAATGPDLVIMDIRLPPEFKDEGLVAARRLKELYPDLGVLVLSAHVMATAAARLLDGQLKGVGYLLKDRVDDVGDFQLALSRVRAGELVVDPDVVRALMRRRRAIDLSERLSERERDVIMLMVEGHTNAAIAARTFLAVKTVEKCVAAVFDKMGLPATPDYNRRVQAVVAWLRVSEI